MKKSFNRHDAWISTPLLVLACLFAWHIYVKEFHVPPILLPAPLDVGGRIIRLAMDPRIYVHVAVTLHEILLGFSIAVVAGVGLGVLLAKWRWLERALSPFIVALQIMPKVALAPIFIVWFGFGPGSKIIMAAVLAVFPIMINTVLGIKSADRGHRDLMMSLCASPLATFREMELPGALPYILSGAEVGIVLAVIGAVVGEYLGGDQGLGYLTAAALNAFDVETMFAVVFVLTLLGLGLYLLVAALRRRLTPWHPSVDGRRGV